MLCSIEERKEVDDCGSVGVCSDVLDERAEVRQDLSDVDKGVEGLDFRDEVEEVVRWIWCGGRLWLGLWSGLRFGSGRCVGVLEGWELCGRGGLAVASQHGAEGNLVCHRR